MAYVFFSGRRIISRNGTGSVYYYFADALGSTRTITDAQGRICYDADFSPYGQEMSHTERLQSTACPPNYKFTGYERDTETGLDYAFARYYSSRLGRFLSADPLGGGVSNPQSMNRYAYVVNRPTVGTDPTGLVCDDDCIQNHGDAWAQRFISGTGGGCTVDGLDAPCSLAHGLLQMGAAVECHGYCSLFFVPTLAANGHWYILGATAEGVSWYNLLNGEPIENTPEVGLPEVDSEQAPGGPGRSGGGGGNTTQCTGKILNVLNQKIGTNFTTANVIGDFPWKGGFNIDVFATGLTAAQFNAIQPGSRWALSWKAAAFGYGPSLHIPKPMSFWDPFAYFHNENIGGRLSVQFTAHIDSAYPSNPIRAVLHFHHRRDRSLQAKCVPLGARRVNFVPSRVSRAPAAVLLAFLVSAGIAHCGASAVTQAASKELFSIPKGNDLPGNFNGIGIQDVAISPDNKRIVVEFKVGEGQGALGTWLGEWEIATKKLLNQARIEGPVQGEAPSHPRFLRRLQFSADGSEIVAIAGRQLYLIDAASLELLSSVSALNAEGRPDPNVFVRSFAISGDGNVLAVLSGPPPLERGYDLVRLLKLKTGEEISRWPLSERSRSISLSMSGEYMLVTLWDPTTPRDILLLDSSTGKKTETFESGFGYGSGYGAWDALFVVPNRFVATPGFGTDQKGRYSGYALRVFDAQAGRVTQELTYEHFGPTAVIAVSNRAPVIVMLNLWMDPKAIKRSDRHVFHRVAQLLFFRLSENQPLCVLDPLPEGDIRMSRSGFLRFSPDLSLFVVLTGSKLTVYTVSNCGSPVPAEVKSITSPSNAASVR